MRNRWPMWLGGVLGIAAFGLPLVGDRLPVEEWGQAARLTARVGFPLLILAYIARPLHQLLNTGATKYLLARRKWVGLGFAITHTIHLAALIMALWVANQPPEAIVLAFGVPAYLLLWAMAFTSNATAMRAMGKWWKRLHTFGIHYLWFIFVVTYSGRLFVAETFWLGVTTETIAVIAATIRFIAWRKVAGKRQTSAISAA